MAFIDSRMLEDGTVIERDLCIVGAGPAGIAIAREFMKTGLSVALLESGDIAPDDGPQALAAGENVGLPGVFKCGCPFYSGNTFGRIGAPPPPMERLESIEAPVMGFFGNDDKNPSPADVDRISALLTALGKEHEFFRYDGTGHAFMGSNPQKFRENSARDAWTRAVKFIALHTGGTAPDVGEVYPIEEAA